MSSSVSDRSSIPVLARQPVGADQPEHREMLHYESGAADESARAIPGRHAEPWLNVLEACEPASPPAMRLATTHPDIRPFIRGRVIDLGAGTCWNTAILSRLDEVDEVVALDLSERFLTEVGGRILRHFDADLQKVGFAVGSFNAVPFPSGSFDCAFLVAAIHHSLSPIKTLLEARRVLRRDGTLIVMESPASLIRIRRERARALQLSRSLDATELCYTKGELHYLLQHAGFDSIRYFPVQALTRGAIRKGMRSCLRALGLEAIIRPPMYVIMARVPGTEAQRDAHVVAMPLR